MLVTADEFAVIKVVGATTFRLARELLQRGELQLTGLGDVSGNQAGLISGEFTGPAPVVASVVIDEEPDGSVLDLRGACSCGAQAPCSHAVALALTQLSVSSGSIAAPPSARPSTRVPSVPEVALPARPPAWARALAPVLASEPNGAGGPGPDGDPGATAAIGLQFERVDRPAPGRRGVPSAPLRLVLRPVLMSSTGNWVRTGISWSNLMYVQVRRSPGTTRQLHLLRELLALRSADGTYHPYGPANSIFLDEIGSRRLWDVLAEAAEVGLALLQPGKRAGSVTVHTGAHASLTATRAGGDLELRPRLHVDGADVPLTSLIPIGPDGQGIAWWEGTSAQTSPLHLAELPRAELHHLTTALRVGEVRVPAQDEERFFAEYFPQLRRRLRVETHDPAVVFPPAGRPVMQLTVERITAASTASGLALHLLWQWGYPQGETRRTAPLDQPLGGDPDRDAAVEGSILAPVIDMVRGRLPGLLETGGARERLAASGMLTGITAVEFLTEIAPALGDLPDVEVTLQDGEATPTFRSAENAPVITFSGAGTATREQDWFDLAVTVTIDEEKVPFNALFLALAHGESHLVLPSGTYFRLDADQFRQLATLIEEARALEDAPPGVIRLSRFQAGLWDELDQLGVVEGQATQWLGTVRALVAAPTIVDTEPPVGLKAMLRPYQQAGFNWLATLYANGLGGVLADDMGLGKTLQALALFCHVREQSDELPGEQSETAPRAPFLVVAPTSVASNWASEARTFAPDLRVVVISETVARRGVELADLVQGVDVVVTSYTLFRIEHEDYADLEWAGLILDEAQFVKNHQSRIHQCAKTLEAPFKLAITGTPMENNLMELWSLLSITAPGLFAHPTRFTDYYRTPIEREADAERLAQLRRRVRPLMLRRTKEQVVSDLPDKQEQVIELELNPKHKKIYQTYLNRERQKVLGLIEDMQRNRFEIFRSLTLLRQASLDVGLVDAKHSSIPSTKLDAMMGLVTDLVAENHRALIFSQFTRFLTGARNRLDEAGIDYCYLDGTTRRRGEVIDRFRNGDAPVFLISLKAGGFGLNLTEADYCILLDPWWNPATEAQAVDRVHRIGQTKKVNVYRLVAKDTIEDKVMALKATKAALFSSVMDGGGFESAALTASDIRGLLS